MIARHLQGFKRTFKTSHYSCTPIHKALLLKKRKKNTIIDTLTIPQILCEEFVGRLWKPADCEQLVIINRSPPIGVEKLSGYL